MTHWPRILSPRSAPSAGTPGPLRGAWIIWTRPAEGGETQAEALAAAGATVSLAPAIEFKTIASRNLELFLLALDHLRQWRGWLILPSPTAIRHFGMLMEQTSLTPAALEGVRVGVIGPGSDAALGALGLAADFQPPLPNAASLASALPVTTGTPVMIAGSSQTRPELMEGLKARGLRVQLLALYDTRPCAEGLRAIEQTLEAHPEALLAAASPSAAEAILDWLEREERERPAARWLTIGPTTRQLLLDRGVAAGDLAAAAAPDAAGLIAAAARLLQRPGPPEARRP